MSSRRPAATARFLYCPARMKDWGACIWKRWLAAKPRSDAQGRELPRSSGMEKAGGWYLRMELKGWLRECECCWETTNGDARLGLRLGQRFCNRSLWRTRRRSCLGYSRGSAFEAPTGDPDGDHSALPDSGIQRARCTTGNRS